MLDLLLYDELCEIKHQIAEAKSKGLHPIVITPNPLQADLLRKLFGSEIDVITLAKFVNDEFSYWQNLIEEKFEFKDKASLLLFLSTIWKRINNSSSFEDFQKSFEQFTELRSFSTHLSSIGHVLELLPENEKNILLVFWKLCENLKVLDEHGRYQWLAENYRHPRDNTEGQLGSRWLLFAQFEFITGNQIDFLKSLGLRDSVLVSLPYNVFTATKNSDWPRWLSTLDKAREPKIDHELNEAEVFFFPKNKMGIKLREHVTIDVPDKEQIVITGLDGQVTDALVQAIPFKSTSYRVKVDIFQSDFAYFFDLDSELAKFFSGNDKNYDDFLQWSSQLKSFLVKEQQFKRFKILTIVEKELKNLIELSDSNQQLSFFDFKLLKSVTELRLPRNYKIDLGREHNIAVKNIDEVLVDEEDRRLYICVNTHNRPAFSKGNSSFSLAVEKHLSSIAPLRTSEMDFLFLEHKVRQALKKFKTIFMLESNILDSDFFLARLFEGIKIRNGNKFPIKEKKNKFEDPLNLSITSFSQKYRTEDLNKSDKISATRLQVFLDCRRKFLFQYLDKSFVRPELKTDLLSTQVGIIEHDVIKTYFENNQNLDLKRLKSLIENKIGQHSKNNSLSLNQVQLYKFSKEIENLAFNGISFLMEIKKLHPSAQFNFEEKFEERLQNVTFHGSIDVVIRTGEGTILLDFKRSSASIPSKSEVEKLKKIQILFYANRLKKENLIGLGYLNLSEIENSLIFSVKNRLSLDDYLGLKEQFSLQPSLIELEKIAELYNELELKTVDAIRTEQVFAPVPASDSVCLFCPLDAICLKETKATNGDLYGQS